MFSHVVTGREDSYSLDGSGGDRVQEVHLGQRCVELRDCHVGGDVIRREAILGDVQSRCKWHAKLFGYTLHSKRVGVYDADEVGQQRKQSHQEGEASMITDNIKNDLKLL